MTRYAIKNAIRLVNKGVYPCARPWPDECYVQCGGGEMLANGMATDYFFEAFMDNPDTFFRGEGSTISDAEARCWMKYRRMAGCSGHEFEARDYENGCGVCKHCGTWASDVIAPIHTCKKCEKPTWFKKDTAGGWWCQDCYWEIPDELLDEMDRENREMRKSPENQKARIAIQAEEKQFNAQYEHYRSRCKTDSAEPMGIRGWASAREELRALYTVAIGTDEAEIARIYELEGKLHL